MTLASALASLLIIFAAPAAHDAGSHETASSELELGVSAPAVLTVDEQAIAGNCADWKATVDDKTGRKYYYNRFTKKTQWNVPADCGGTDEKNQADCGSWKRTRDVNTERTYYYNTATKKTRWELPEACKPKKVDEKSIAEVAREEARKAIAEREDAICGGWKVAKDGKSGKTYYYNPKTKETQWERPENCASLDADLREAQNDPARQAGSGPCADWLPAKDKNSGKTYYYNKNTKQTKWSKPSDCTP